MFEAVRGGEMMWRRGRDKDKIQIEEVIAEAENLLSGRTLEMYGLRGPRVWSLLASLAHSDRDQLRVLSGTQTFSHPGSFDATLAYLAGELLAMARTGPELVQVQRRVLIPVELQVLADDIPAPTTPAQLVTLVMGALDRYHIHPDG
jgi:hypothetical protein